MSLKKDLAMLDRAQAELRVGAGSVPSAESLGLSYWLVRYMTDAGQIGSARRIAAKSAKQARAKHDHFYSGYGLCLRNAVAALFLRQERDF